MDRLTAVILIVLGALGIFSFWIVPPLAQSNIPFLIIGLWGMRYVRSETSTESVDPRGRWMYLLLFCGVAVMGLGSAYYHLALSYTSFSTRRSIG